MIEHVIISTEINRLRLLAGELSASGNQRAAEAVRSAAAFIEALRDDRDSVAKTAHDMAVDKMKRLAADAAIRHGDLLAKTIAGWSP